MIFFVGETINTCKGYRDEMRAAVDGNEIILGESPGVLKGNIHLVVNRYFDGSVRKSRVGYSKYEVEDVEKPLTDGGSCERHEKITVEMPSETARIEPFFGKEQTNRLPAHAE